MIGTVSKIKLSKKKEESIRVWIDSSFFMAEGQKEKKK